MSFRPRPACEICGSGAEGRDPYPCPCGGEHRVCLGCCFAISGLLLKGSRLSMCPVTDEFKVVRAVMGDD